jgi:hypothetical protein
MFRSRQPDGKPTDRCPAKRLTRGFRDEDTCAQYLADRRWPKGFVCPSCGTCKGWPLTRKRSIWECAGCAPQTSVTAGTVMHASDLPLRTWFLAAHIMTSHSNGMSALLRQAQLGLGSYKTASPSSLEPMALLGDRLLQRLRRALRGPDRNPLKALVEIDETEMPFRSRHDPNDRPKGGHSPAGKMFVVGAVEWSADGQPRRIRIEHVPDGSSMTLHGLIGRADEPACISSWTGGSAILSRPRTRMRPRSSPAGARRRSCIGCIACSPT